MLKEIIRRKKEEVKRIHRSDSLLQLMRDGQKPSIRFSQTLLRERGLSVIAEIKRKSPSKGVFHDISDPVHLAKRYEMGGARAISVLTDQEGFNGNLSDLEQVSKSVAVPTLRKDFIVDPIQIAEAALCGASAVLFIVSALGEDLKYFLEEVHRMGLEALCEVHTEKELELALSSLATLIGVNNRNLNTFEVDLNVSKRLVKFIPNEVVKVAASGIHSKEQALRMIGYDAVLIGEALVSSPHPETLIQEIKGCSYKDLRSQIS